MRIDSFAVQVAASRRAQRQDRNDLTEDRHADTGTEEDPTSEAQGTDGDWGERRQPFVMPERPGAGARNVEAERVSFSDALRASIGPTTAISRSVEAVDYPARAAAVVAVPESEPAAVVDNSLRIVAAPSVARYAPPARASSYRRESAEPTVPTGLDVTV